MFVTERIACVDVDYRVASSVAACVLFADWGDAVAARAWSVTLEGTPAAYVPGSFALRELPPVLAVLAGARVEVVVVDGYVSFGPGRPGLGEHLHRALGVTVVGVAKSPFAGAAHVPVLRGTSRKPLYVTAVGMDAADAGRHVAAMHGAHRVPTMLRRVDALSRGRG